MERTKKSSDEAVEVPMAPMIDIVFLLLIYFITTFQPQPVEAHMAVNMPAPDMAAQEPRETKPVEVWITPEGFLWGGARLVSSDDIREKMMQVSSLDATVTVLIKVHNDAVEGQLVEILDCCSYANLSNLNILTLKHGSN